MLADVELYVFCAGQGEMRTLRARKNATACGGGAEGKKLRLGRDQNGQVERNLRHRLIQYRTGVGLAAAAAIRAAGAGLQFGEAPNAIGRGATDIVIGNGVAQAYVHAAYFQRECE
jgi:hypothetical protein